MSKKVSITELLKGARIDPLSFPTSLTQREAKAQRLLRKHEQILTNRSLLAVSSIGSGKIAWMGFNFLDHIREF